MAAYVSWARLLAASGVAAVTYAYRDPAADLQALLAFLRRDGRSLRLDASRLGLWACSGNVPVALSTLMERASGPFRCTALCYGYMLDQGSTTFVADAAQAFGFANPTSGKSIKDLPEDIPLFVVRAGQDSMPHLNDSVDLFLAEANEWSLPVTVSRLPDAPHAFDLFDDSDEARDGVRAILAFFRAHLRGPTEASGAA